MKFYPAKDMQVGKRYQLTEYVEGKRMTSGVYYLVWMDGDGKEGNPPLGFSTAQPYAFKKPRPPRIDVYLTQAHAQFGSPTWRHSFKNGNNWDVYWPAGGETWNHSYVIVEDCAA